MTAFNLDSHPAPPPPPPSTPSLSLAPPPPPPLLSFSLITISLPARSLGPRTGAPSSWAAGATAQKARPSTGEAVLVWGGVVGWVCMDMR